MLDASDAAKARALVAYGTHGNVTAACAAAGVSRQTWYRWLEDDPAFAHRADETREAVLDGLEQKAMERAQEASDTLLIFLLKSHRRERYGDRTRIEVVSPEVQDRLRRTLALIRSRPRWEAEALIAEMRPLWVA